MGLMLRWRRAAVRDAQVLGGYLVLTGAVRFLIEFIRVNERVALGMTVAQWAALVIGVACATFILWSPGSRPREAHVNGAAI